MIRPSGRRRRKMAGNTVSATRLMFSKSTMSCLPQWEDNGRELITTIGLDEIDRKLLVFLEVASQIRVVLNLGHRMKERFRAERTKALSQISGEISLAQDRSLGVSRGCNFGQEIQCLRARSRSP